MSIEIYPGVSVSENPQGFNSFVKARHLPVDFLVKQVVQNSRSPSAKKKGGDA